MAIYSRFKWMRSPAFKMRQEGKEPTTVLSRREQAYIGLKSIKLSV
jgi:hypothetical protein